MQKKLSNQAKRIFINLQNIKLYEIMIKELSILCHYIILYKALKKAKNARENTVVVTKIINLIKSIHIF